MDKHADVFMMMGEIDFDDDDQNNDYIILNTMQAVVSLTMLKHHGCR